ncbi:hypothetical protein [Clostridium sp.]|uniref:hypothetical protein n=1 Tax=Clostridium sp. TaxID=1506 RepID=UPI0026364853|nr:hypothetical protein [uncultured Clostridium sp.]
MKFDGSSKEKRRPLSLKCPCSKSKKTAIKGKKTYILSYENPCTPSPCGRMYRTNINDNYRLYTIYKFSMGVGYTKLRNTVSLKVEVTLTAITQQIIILIADKFNKKSHLLSIKSLIT